jgi:WD40 repeat protein
VATAGTNHTVVVWEIFPEPQGRRRFELRGHQGPVYGLAFSPDGEWLASAGWDQAVVVWNLRNGIKIRDFPAAHEEGVWGIDFACCGKVLSTAGQDGVAKVWDAETGAELARFTRHRGTVHVARFVPDGSFLLTGGRDGTARIWPIQKPGKK